MVKIKDLMKAVGSLSSPFANDESLPDDETRDKGLRSLRRQKRMIMDRKEKERLRKFVEKEQRNRDREIFKSHNVQQGSILKKSPRKREKRFMTRKSNILR